MNKCSNISRVPRIEEGSKVEANYRGKGKYFQGRIKRDRGDGTFDVDYYNDGEVETRVPADMIRLLDVETKSSASYLFVGAAVEGKDKRNGKWYPGKIRRLRSDGTCDIDYDDGEIGTGIPGDMIRLLDAVDDSLEVVATLLERGADPDLPDKVHGTLLI